jgi:iron complex outermembrane receptor protein
LNARKEWSGSSGNTRHFQAQVSISDQSFSDIMEPNKAVQGNYEYFNLRTGVSNDDWSAEIYVDNVMDSRANISNTFVFDRQRIAVIKPRTIGLRYKRSF